MKYSSSLLNLICFIHFTTSGPVFKQDSSSSYYNKYSDYSDYYNEIPSSSSYYNEVPSSSYYDEVPLYHNPAPSSHETPLYSSDDYHNSEPSSHKNKQSPVSSEHNLMQYLIRFGYMSPISTRTKNEGDFMSESVKMFQEFAGLEMTGKVDEATKVMMEMPRCGVKDIGDQNYVAHHRSKRYILQGSKWKSKKLTYKIASYPTNFRVDLTQDQVDSEIKKALDLWAKVSNLEFEEKKDGKVNIEIRFATGDHGDDDPFDGPGNILAHAFFPTFGGDAHFDNSELWTVESYRGTNLFLTAAHEFGHSLGLSHSSNHKALMAPFYRGYRPGQEVLHKDDITGIQALYGRNLKVDPTEPSAPVDNDMLCGGGGVDTIVTTDGGDTYVFKGDLFWKLTAESVETGYPKRIWDEWDGLPGDLDASFTWTNGKMFFFKGTKYWRFSNGKMDRGYPKKISTSFAGIPNDLDAALLWSGNNKIYFFKKGKYWKFDPYSRPSVDKSYPKSVSKWGGIPYDLDAAVKYSNGRTYFFKDGLYYRFDDEKLKVDVTNPSFPRPTGKWWFGCEDGDYGLQKKQDDGDIVFDSS